MIQLGGRRSLHGCFSCDLLLSSRASVFKNFIRTRSFVADLLRGSCCCGTGFRVAKCFRRSDNASRKFAAAQEIREKRYINCARFIFPGMVLCRCEGHVDSVFRNENRRVPRGISCLVSGDPSSVTSTRLIHFRKTRERSLLRKVVRCTFIDQQFVKESECDSG